MRWLIWLCVVGCRGGSSAPSDATGIDGAQLVPLTPDEATDACIVFGSCLGDGINDCFTDAMPFWTVAEARCVIAAASDCTAARACLGQIIMQDPSCTPGVACDGDALVTCTNGVRVTVSCPSASPLVGVGTGSTCVMTANDAFCADAPCSADSATCSGSVASVCLGSEGVAVSLDCADYSQTCAAGSCTSAGGGATCTAGAPASCRGDSIVRCENGLEVTRSCAAIADSATCFPGDVANPEPYCGFGNACYPTKGDETCAGNSVSFCAAGQPATIDCTSLGFSTCLGGKCF